MPYFLCYLILDTSISTHFMDACSLHFLFRISIFYFSNGIIAAPITQRKWIPNTVQHRSRDTIRLRSTHGFLYCSGSYGFGDIVANGLFSRISHSWGVLSNRRMKSYWSVAVLAGLEVSAASKKNSSSSRKDILNAISALNIQNQSCLSAPPDSSTILRLGSKFFSPMDSSIRKSTDFC